MADTDSYGCHMYRLLITCEWTIPGTSLCSTSLYGKYFHNKVTSTSLNDNHTENYICLISKATKLATVSHNVPLCLEV